MASFSVSSSSGCLGAAPSLSVSLSCTYLFRATGFSHAQPLSFVDFRLFGAMAQDVHQSRLLRLLYLVKYLLLRLLLTISMMGSSSCITHNSRQYAPKHVYFCISMVYLSGKYVIYTHLVRWPKGTLPWLHGKVACIV